MSPIRDFDLKKLIFLPLLLATTSAVSAQDTQVTDQQLLDAYNNAKPSVTGVTPQTRGEIIKCAALSLNNLTAANNGSAKMMEAFTPDFSMKNLRWMMIHWLTLASATYTKAGRGGPEYDEDLNSAFADSAKLHPMKLMSGLGGCYVPEAKRKAFNENMFKTK